MPTLEFLMITLPGNDQEIMKVERHGAQTFTVRWENRGEIEDVVYDFEQMGRDGITNDYNKRWDGEDLLQAVRFKNNKLVVYTLNFEDDPDDLADAGGRKIITSKEFPSVIYSDNQHDAENLEIFPADCEDAISPHSRYKSSIKQAERAAAEQKLYAGTARGVAADVQAETLAWYRNQVKALAPQTSYLRRANLAYCDRYDTVSDILYAYMSAHTWRQMRDKLNKEGVPEEHRYAFRLVTTVYDLKDAADEGSTEVSDYTAVRRRVDLLREDIYNFNRMKYNGHYYSSSAIRKAAEKLSAETDIDLIPAIMIVKNNPSTYNVEPNNGLHIAPAMDLEVPNAPQLMSKGID